MQVSLLLRAARSVIATDDKWYKGKQVHVNKDGNSCYCAVGALKRACEIIGDYSAYTGALTELDNVVKGFWPITGSEVGSTLIAYNDNQRTTHKGIMLVFDEAIARAKEAERLDFKRATTDER